MTWFQQLYETYRNVADNPLFANEESMLVPIAHTSMNANIIVRINGKGNFLGAEFIGKKSVVLPATEESAGRTGKKRVAHPLLDKIKYCAKDYPAYSGKEGYFSKETLNPATLKKELESQPVTYEETLHEWVRSPYSHPMTEAVYAYVCQGTLIRDLIGQGILSLDKSGKLATASQSDKDRPLFAVLQKDKNTGEKYQGELVVAWQVEIPGTNETKTWECEELQKSWEVYSVGQMQRKGLCMVTGEWEPLASNHPKYIRKSGDKAKLISSNADSKGFYVYRGRFICPDEACSVGYLTTQMAHNALRWLIKRQGCLTPPVKDEEQQQVTLAWAPKGIHVPQLFDETWMEEVGIPDFSEDNESATVEPDETTGKPVPDYRNDLGRTFARKLKHCLRGYEEKIKADNTIVILGLDSATDGRLAVTFYQEQLWPEYAEKLESWQKDMAWLMTRFREAKGRRKKSDKFTCFVAPKPDEIAETAYGKRADTQLRKKTVERLLTCIATRKPIPFDLVTRCFDRARNRMGFKDGEKWEVALGVACAVYKGYFARHPIEQHRRIYKMSLDETNTSRCYLYGRLLAVAEWLERKALTVAEQERPTNAERMMQYFSDSPYKTWHQLELALQPYRQRLFRERRGFLHHMDKLIDEIMHAFDPVEFTKPERLSGEFLLGYHCQRYAFSTASPSKSTENMSGENP